ncbi:MAG: hypothetical protein OSJ60_20480 [Lachnospiraceae bacterium]|nr:hypothetical protein [Lachnospiraceae bacterium]
MIIWVTFRPFINFSNDAMAVKSRDNLFDKPFKMLDLLRNAKWENSFLSKIALFTHSLKKVIPTFLLKTFEFISFIIKGRDNKKVVITITSKRKFLVLADCKKRQKIF